MEWDVEIESPATLAILGAGSVGLEAAIYARFLGYYVEIFDTGRPVRHLKYQGDLLVDDPYQVCTSSLGRAAIEAQSGTPLPFSMDSRPSYDELCENYFLPLAKTDLLFDHIHFLSKVVSISRYQHWTDDCSLQDRANDEFRILVNSKNRGYWTCRVDAVLDCTGRTSSTLNLGPGGGMAIGEIEFGDSVITSLRHADRAKDFSKVVVAGNHARLWATLAHWKKEGRKIERLTWLAPVHEDYTESPFSKWLLTTFPDLVVIPYRGLESITREADSWKLVVLMANGQTADLQCSTLLATHGEVIDWSYGNALKPLWFGSENCDEWPAKRLATSEPNYYVLGSKRDPNANWSSIRSEIKDLFAMLGARRDLDLYASFAEKK